MTSTVLPKNKIDRKRLYIFLLDHIIEICLIILIVGLSFSGKNFLTWANWMNILRANALKGVIAFGMTMVIIANLIDLSIGSTVGLAGVIVAVACRDLSAGGMDLTLACAIGMAASILLGIGVGWLHGFFQHKTGMPAFIVTLTTLFALLGLSGKLSGGFPVPNQFPDWYNKLGGGRVGGMNGIPIPAIVLMICFFIIWFIMKFTTTGRSTYAVGGNPESARLSGIDVGKTKIIAFVVVQIMAVISGFMTSGQVMAGTFTFGKGWELDVIAAVVVGCRWVCTVRSAATDRGGKVSDGWRMRKGGHRPPSVFEARGRFIPDLGPG